jgi:hypothetical protein
MKRILLAAGVASAALVAAGLTAPAALASGTNATCIGGLPPGTYQNVTVPAGARCTIDGSDTITGNVTVATGAALIDGADGAGALIGGNLQADHAQEVEVFGGSVGGNVQLTAMSGQSLVCGGTVGNDLVAQDNAAHSGIGDTGIGCPGERIGGNLTVQNNPGDVEVVANTVAGNISVHNNTGGGDLVSNSAGGSCQLFNDNPPILGDSNTVPPGHQNTCNQAA